MKMQTTPENNPPSEVEEDNGVTTSQKEVLNHGPETSLPLIINDVRPTFSESFHLLVQEIKHLTEREHFKTIMVMGAYPRDGRTTILANLGVSLAMEGHRVILIDADDQNPYLRNIVVPGRKPTRYWLRGTLKYRGWTLDWVPDQEIFMIAPEHPEQLEPDAIAQLVRSLKSTFDFILIDSPPCLGNEDAFQLATLVDGVIYVVRRRPQDMESQRRVKFHLESLDVNLLGVIYNEV